MSYAVTKRVSFCYGHRLHGYRGKCGNLHGHNAVAEVTLRVRSLDAMGMAYDFERIKNSIGNWVAAELDHRTLLNAKDPLAAALKAHGEPVVAFKGNPTAEAIARLIYGFAAKAGMPVSSVRVWESPTSAAEYSG